MQEYLSQRDTANAVKGVAIILMFIHHFFTFPSWYIEGIAYPHLEEFAGFFCLPTKICVSIFAFLTGYFYITFSKRTYRHAFKKIIDIMISYWVVFLPMLLLALIWGVYQFEFPNVLLEAFALERSIMVFCWYIPFYICLMLLLPVVTKLLTKSMFLDVVILSVVQGVLVLLAHEIQIPYLTETLESVSLWFMFVMAGCLVAKYKLYDKVFDTILMGSSPKFTRLPIAVVMVVIPFLLQNKELTSRLIGMGEGVLDVQRMQLLKALMLPFFLYGLLQILFALKNTVIFNLLVQLGKMSMSMWFIHCMFFNVCKYQLQPILYFLRNPLLVLVFGCAVCYLLARLLEPVRTALVGKVNHLLRFD